MSKPGLGERAASSGYRAQYLLGASIINEKLKSGDLEWIKIADPEIGRVDDLQICSSTIIDAYQVKWEQYPGAITFNDLISKNDKNPPLFTQLAEGWQKLKTNFPHKRIVVHLITNQYPSASTKAKLPKSKKPPSPYHFSAFIEQEWKRIHSNDESIFSTTWEPIWSEIKNVTSLSDDEFIRFVKDCSLDFQTIKPIENTENITVSDLLFSTAANPERRIEYTREELINQLGWKNKFQSYNLHEFPNPQYTYKPIKNTVEKLINSLDSLPGGYIAFLGSPGSGKSTLLTQTLRNLPLRTIRYYAYIPDAQDPSGIRGESINFLNHITLKLSQAGINADENRDPTNRIQLIKILNNQLRKLGDEFIEKGEKTLILIDGLDHIPREQNPERSLLCDLPLPENIPNGVYILLGTQTIELQDLPPNLKNHLNSDGRKITIEHISVNDTRAISLSARSDLCEEELQRIYELSEGHPLALIYLLREIQNIGDPVNRKRIFDIHVAYNGDIDNYYSSHWESISTDETLLRTLGLLCRIRDSIYVEWVATWTDSKTLRKISKHFSSYFDVENEKKWTFFHNSFRLFLLSKTIDPLPGLSTNEQEKKFHIDLANKYRDSQTPYSWETLYHFYMAEAFESVLELATWEWFTKQIISLRPLDAVENDIKLCIKAAGKCKDIVLLARLTLIGAAVRQRLNVIDDIDFSKLLLEAEKHDLAFEYLRDGNQLRVNKKTALIASLSISENGFAQEARKLFELAEPHEYLSETGIQNYNRDIENILIAWVKSSIKFRNTDEIVTIIKRIKVIPRENSKKSKKNESRKLQNLLFFQGVIGCCELGEWDLWNIFYKNIIKGNDKIYRLFAIIRSLSYAQEQNNISFIQKHLPNFVSMYPPQSFMDIKNNYLRQEACTTFAEFLSNIPEKKHTAYQYIKDLPQIPLFNSDLEYNEKPLQQENRFRLAKLYYLLEQNPFSENILLENAEKNTDSKFSDQKQTEIYRLVARATYVTAKLWAIGKTGNYYSTHTFVDEIKWIFDVFGCNWDKQSINARTSIGETRFTILECVIVAANEHGKIVLNAVKDDLARRWTDTNESTSWWSGLQRKLINLFSIYDIDKKWIGNQLDRIAPNILEGLDPYSKAEERKLQAESWLIINENTKAFNELCLIPNAARGIRSDEDYQLSEWVRWINYTENVVSKKEQQKRILKMFRIIINEKDTISGISEASEELLDVVFQWNPINSINLYKIVLEENLLSFERGIIQLLLSALNSSTAPLVEIEQIITNLVFPFVVNSSPEMMKNLIISKHNQYGFFEAKKLAQTMINKICINSLSKNRSNWINGLLSGFESIGGTKTQLSIDKELLIIKDEETNQFDRSLHLQNGQTITFDELISSVKTLPDLEIILNEYDKTKSKFFEWTTLFEKLVPIITDDQYLQEFDSLIIKFFSGHSFQKRIFGKYYIAISRWYQDNGNSELAWKYAQNALEAVKTSSWLKHSDEGVKLEALQHMQNIDSTKTNDFIYDLYANDLTDYAYYPENYLTNLYEFLSIIRKGFPKKAIWIEIEKYLDDLFINSKLLQNEHLESILFSSEYYLHNSTPQSSMIYLLILFLTYPSYVVAHGAIKGFTEIPNENQLVLNTINKVLESKNDLLIERTLMIIEAYTFNEKNISSLLFLKKNLFNLTKSDNFSIRLASSKIIAKFDATKIKVICKNNELPAIYQIELLQESSFQTLNTLNKKQNLNIIGDPAKILSPLDIEIRQIAEMANLNVDNAMYHAKQLFDVLAKNNIWINTNTKITDKRLLAFLENTGMYITHNKPHICAARQALSYIIAELYDCNYLTVKDSSIIESMLLLYDVNLSSFSISPRPNYIPRMIDKNENTYYQIFNKSWIEKSIESIDNLSEITDDNFVIIGEKTKLKFLNQDWPSEFRYSSVQSSKVLNPNIENDIQNGLFPSFRAIKYLKQYYEYINPCDEEVILVNDPFEIENPGANWLAINPTLARKLGWKMSSDGLFTWKNKSNEITVKSIWWRDGCFDLQHRHAHDEVGEGWVVLATKSAWKEILSYYGGLNRYKIINRRLGFLGSKDSRIYKEIQLIN